MKRTMVCTNCSRSAEASADTKFHKILRLLVACVLALTISPAMHGQATGSFSGNVLDKSGSGIAGATVIATSQGTGLTRDTKTDSAGHYLLPLLPVGIYTVHVDATGFQSVESKDLKLQTEEARELDFPLLPATVVTTVAVSGGDAVAVESANPSLGQVITSQQVSQLPLNGRDFVQLATLTAGATAETNPNSFFTSAASSEVAARGSFSLSVGGSRPNATDWLLDGVDNNELTAGGIAIFSSIDSIQEFKVLTYTYSAEYGTRAGPTVLVTTKSGSNDFHGTLYEFLRNTSLDADSYFATSRQKFNLNDFGGSVGGPIRKNKTFFFIDGEQKYQLQDIPFTGLVPSLAMRTGDFSSDPFGNPVSGPIIVNPNMVGAATPANPNAIYFQCNAAGVPLPANPDGSQAPGTPCNKIPANLINPIGQAMINLYPDPNANNASAGINYTSQPVRQLDDTRFDTRRTKRFLKGITPLAVSATTRHSLLCPAAHQGLPKPTPSAATSASGTTRATSPWARPMSSPPTWSTRPLLVTTASSTTSPRKARGRAHRPPSAAAFPTPTWDASTTNACPAHIAAGWFRPSSRAVIGPSAIAATLRSRVEPTSSLSGIPSITSAISMTSDSGSTIALIK